MLTWYDVCSDYSLDERKTEPLNLEKLEIMLDTFGKEVYITEGGEAVYLLAESGLQGCYLEEWED